MKINFRFLPKMCMMMLLLGNVVGAHAATIIYKLTTHTRTTNQTLTGTANLSTGASLLNNMPQALWRAYCTYTFYSDEAMTQEITTAPSTASTVYVDYVFDPPFILSQEGSDPVWHNFRTYSQEADAYYIFVKSEDNVANTSMPVMGWKDGVPSYGEMNHKMIKEGHAQWAFYGDAYDFHIMVNEDGSGWGDNVWLVPYSNINRARLGAKKTIGWQLLVNKASNNKISGSMMAMQDPESGKFAVLNNLSDYIGLSNLDSRYHYLTSKNELASVTTGQSPLTNAEKLWWYAFFATPVSSDLGNTKYLTTFVIIKAYDYNTLRTSWYSQAPKASNSKRPADMFIKPVSPVTIPEGYTALSYTFYEDEALTKPWGTTKTYVSYYNSTIYVKESCPIEDHWTTFVSPIDITNPATYFGSKDDGVTPAIAIQEYKSVALEQVGTDVVNAELTFETVNTIEAGKPYLINFDGVGSIMKAKYETARDDAVTNNAETLPECIAVGKTDDDNSVSGVTVSMKGTYSEIPLAAHNSSSDELNFYLGYLKNSKTYKFYVVTKEGFKLPAYHCYFYITGASDVNLSYTGVADGIGEIISSTPASFSVNGVYNLNGQLVRGGNSIDGLPAGIYVVNGKKLVVR